MVGVHVTATIRQCRVTVRYFNLFCFFEIHSEHEFSSQWSGIAGVICLQCCCVMVYRNLADTAVGVQTRRNGTQ
jgi:hypothetical protein